MFCSGSGVTICTQPHVPDVLQMYQYMPKDVLLGVEPKDSIAFGKLRVWDDPVLECLYKTEDWTGMKGGQATSDSAAGGL